MIKQPQPEALDHFVDLVIGALPDSHSQRKDTLIVLLALLPRNYDRRALLMQSLQALHAHDHAQMRLLKDNS